MRKLFFALCIALFSVMSLKAQEKGDVELGFVGGVTISNLSGLDKWFIINNNYRLGVNRKYDIESISRTNFGVSFDYYFLDQLSLRVKLLYDSKGAKIEGNSFFPRFDKDIRLGYNIRLEYHSRNVHQLNYFSIPILANWHFGFSESKNFNLNFGPYIAFLLGDLKYDVDYDYVFTRDDGVVGKPSKKYKEKFEGKIEESFNLNRKWFKERYNGFDFGFAFGLGYKFNLSDHLRLLVEYEGQAGLLDIYRDKNEYREGIEVSGNVFDINIKNFRHAFNVGLVFNLTSNKKESETSH